LQRVEIIKKLKTFIFQLLFINLLILTIAKRLLKQVLRSVNKLKKNKKTISLNVSLFCVEQDFKRARTFQNKKQNSIEILNLENLIYNTYLRSKNILRTQYNS